MILDRPLTEQERLQAEQIYCRFLFVDAIAGNCSGATIQILLAISFGIGTAWVSAIGALNYFSYLLLPFGFYFAGKWGVAKKFRNFAWLIGIMCFLTASASVLPSVRILLFFTGVLLKYFCTSCRSSMSFPLQKNITTDKTISRLLSKSQLLSASVGLCGSLIIAWTLSRWDNAIVLPLLFCIAGFFYFCSGSIITRIPEPSVMKEFAARPIFPQVKTAWQNGLVRKQLGTGVVLNLSLATMVAVNMVAAKKGCGMNNVQSLFLSTIQLVTVIIGAIVFKYFAGHFGPRKMMIAGYPLLWFLALYWCFIPFSGCGFMYAVPPFILGGLLTVFFSVSLNNYFTISVPNTLQIGGTFLVFTVTGGAVGVLGIVINPVIFKIAEFFPSEDPMFPFRVFYTVTGVCSLPGILSPVRLPVKYLEYRLKNH